MPAVLLPWKSTIVERLDKDDSLEAHKAIKSYDLYWPDLTKDTSGPLAEVDIKLTCPSPKKKTKKL